MALRPIEPGTEGRPDTHEEHKLYKKELADMDDRPEAWANDPALARVKAKIAEQASKDATVRAAETERKAESPEEKNRREIREQAERDAEAERVAAMQRSTSAEQQKLAKK